MAVEDHISETMFNGEVDKPQAIGVEVRQEAPAYIKSLSPEQRAAAEKALVRKIDLRLIPTIIIIYIMNYLDRNNIAAARLAGLEDDLNLHGTQYQTAVSILFVGYLLMQIPSNLFLNKFGKPSIYLSTAMVIWGMISMATAGVQNFGGLIAVRFFLGFIEAAYFPGCLYYLSAWYTRKELGFRTAMLYSGSLLSGAFSGLIAAGITEGMDGLHGLRAWRWLFIIEGGITIGIALMAFFILPNFPSTTPWLSADEKTLATWRLQEDIGEEDRAESEQGSFLHGANLAFQDIKMWILMVILFCIVFSGSVTNFFPTVVATLGYSKINSLLLTCPPYVLAVMTTFLNAWHADRTGERYFHITTPLYFAIVAFVLAAATTTTAPRYLAMMLMIPGIYTGYVVCLGWISNTLPRPAPKRAAAIAAINAVSNTSSIFASYMYPKSAGPRYVLAMSLCCATAGTAIIFATILRFILVKLNRKLDRGEFVEGAINSPSAGGRRSSLLESGQAVPSEAASKGFRFLV